MLNPEELKPGQLFDGRYRLVEPISKTGGTADVWLVLDTETAITSYDEEGNELPRDENTATKEALKIYRQKNALDIEGKEKFIKEYKIAHECRHTNLITPQHYGIYEDTPYLILPYCPKGSSEQLISSGATEERVWKYIQDVAAGLKYLHANNPQIIHQDIKPANILIDNMGNFAITDFGISSQSGGRNDYYYDDDGNHGTLAYMAPERFDDDAEPIPSSDIWALGATLCEILTGCPPFGQKGGRSQKEEKLPMPAIPKVPADIVRLIHACLDPDPAKRPTAAMIVAAAGHRQYPVRRNPLRFVFAAAVAVALIGTGIFITHCHHEEEMSTPTPEEVFNETMATYMSSDNRDSLEVGLAIMDSLGKMDYVPALYEYARTYGWELTEESRKRKDLLGVAYYINDKDKEGMPKEDEFNTLGKSGYYKIIQLQDSVCVRENAMAAFYYALYLLNPRDNDKVDHKKVDDYLEEAMKWAIQGNETKLIDRIQQYKKDKNNENKRQ